jgi:hypothetical protein
MRRSLGNRAGASACQTCGRDGTRGLRAVWQIRVSTAPMNRLAIAELGRHELALGLQGACGGSASVCPGFRSPARRMSSWASAIVDAWGHRVAVSFRAGTSQ